MISSFANSHAPNDMFIVNALKRLSCADASRPLVETEQHLDSGNDQIKSRASSVTGNTPFGIAEPPPLIV